MRIHRDLLGWGVFFIVAGAIPLAVQAGLVLPTAIERWWSLWPLILVGIGLGLVFTKSPLEVAGGLLVSATLGLMVGGAAVSGFGGSGGFSSGVCGQGDGGIPFEPQSGTLAPTAAVAVELDCGRLEIGTTAGTAWSIEGRAAGGRGPQIESDGETLDIHPPDGFGDLLSERDQWMVRLPSDATLDVRLDLNAGVIDADFGGARLSTLALDLNAGQATLDLRAVEAIERVQIGVNAGELALDLPALSMTGSIEANAGSVRLCAPPGVALRLDTDDSVLAGQDFGDAGLVSNGGTWETPGYDTAAIRIELRTQANAGSFRLDPTEGCS